MTNSADGLQPSTKIGRRPAHCDIERSRDLAGSAGIVWVRATDQRHIHVGTITPLWAAIYAAIAELEQNQDLQLTTTREYVVGFLCERLVRESSPIEGPVAHPDA